MSSVVRGTRDYGTGKQVLQLTALPSWKTFGATFAQDDTALFRRRTESGKTDGMGILPLRTPPTKRDRLVGGAQGWGMGLLWLRCLIHHEFAGEDGACSWELAAPC